MLCIFTGFRLLRTCESGSKYLLCNVLNLNVDFKHFLVNFNPKTVFQPALGCAQHTQAGRNTQWIIQPGLDHLNTKLALYSDPHSALIFPLYFLDFNWKRCLFRTISVIILLFIAETIPSFGNILDLVGASTVTLLVGNPSCTYSNKLGELL